MTDWEHDLIEELVKQDQEDHRRLEAKVDKLIEDVAALKVKASVWGLLAGSIGGALAWILSRLPV